MKCKRCGNESFSIERRPNGNKEEKMIEVFNFGKALELMKQGKRVARLGWNVWNKEVYLFYQKEYITTKEDDSTVINPYFIIGTKYSRNYWHSTAIDILAEDWYEVI